MADPITSNDDITDEIYINGFNIGMKASDSQLYLYLNGMDIITVNLSLMMFKNLAKKMSQEVERYEKDLGVNIEDMDEVQKKIDNFNIMLKESKK